jgi:hypothetical protein
MESVIELDLLYPLEFYYSNIPSCISFSLNLNSTKILCNVVIVKQ